MLQVILVWLSIDSIGCIKALAPKQKRHLAHMAALMSLTHLEKCAFSSNLSFGDQRMALMRAPMLKHSPLLILVNLCNIKTGFLDDINRIKVCLD